MIDNLYSVGGFYWWTGVVEDRNDPLFLGRCRVRIFGYHTEDRTSLPVTDLPWAYPLQPITSAAMNGVGSTPLGPVEGTWVVGFFRDGENCQDPIILGTTGGVPQPNSGFSSSQNTPTAPGTVGTPANEQIVSRATGTALASQPVAALPASTGVIGPLTETDLKKLDAAIRERESNNTYGVISALGYIGAYQFGGLLLQELGYVQSGTVEKWRELKPDDGSEPTDYAATASALEPSLGVPYEGVPDNSKSNFNFFILAHPQYWSLRGGSSPHTFLGSDSIQDAAIRASYEYHYRGLVRRSIVDTDASKAEVAGFLFAAHLVGIDGVKKMTEGVDRTDANGVRAIEYYNIGYALMDDALPLEQPLPPPAVVSPPAMKASNKSLTLSKPEVGFDDPNHYYPRTEYIGEPDTNRLARHQSISKTIVKRKDDERIRGVPVALGGEWDQPPVPYNAKYPFNHVFESESGHVIEHDDTPGNERIHTFHKTGTFEEWDRNGTVVRRIVGDNYTILERNGNVYIRGKLNVTVDGSCNILVLNDCNLEVNGNMKTHVHKDYELNVAGRIRVVAGDRIDVKGGGNVNVQSGKNINVKSENAIKLAGEKISLKASGTLGLQGSSGVNLKTGVFKVQAGAWPVSTMPSPTFVFILGGSGAQSASTGKAVLRLSPKEPKFPNLSIPSRSEEVAFDLDVVAEHPVENKELINAIQQKAIEEGIIEPQELKQEPHVAATDDTTETEKEQPEEDCGDVYSFSTYPSTYMLTDRVSLASVSSDAGYSKYPVQAQHGLDIQDIVCNLRHVSLYVLEPIMAKYPTAQVTSGFRPRVEGAARVSQHELGEAIDIQFPGLPNSDYFTIAQWIRRHIPYDQMLLEYKSTGTKKPWIHLSFKKTGCRNTCSTFFNHQTAPGGRGTLLQLA